jgi:FKBP-type peptidyl-prolyl cis-trans isomerase FklB
MSRHLLLSLCLAVPAIHAAPTPPADPAHDLAYSIGASLGERLRQDAPGLQLDALVEGLRQAYEDQPLALSEQRIGQILADYEAQAAPAPPASEVDGKLAAERRFMANERARAGVREVAEGVLATELQAGTGQRPTADGRVQVRYIGRLPDGTVFDQSAQPQWFRLGSVIEGWRDALQQMPVGAKWRVAIASDKAYGAEGAGDLIAPYTPLVFEIELVGVGG